MKGIDEGVVTRDNAKRERTIEPEIGIVRDAPSADRCEQQWKCIPGKSGFARRYTRAPGALIMMDQDRERPLIIPRSCRPLFLFFLSSLFSCSSFLASPLSLSLSFFPTNFNRVDEEMLQ